MKYTYYYYSNIITKDKIKNLNKFISNNADNSLKDNYNNKIKKRTDVKVIKWGSLKNEIEPIEDYIDKCNQEAFNFETYRFNKLDGMNHNTYSSKNKGCYNYHVDGSPYEKECTLKLTALLNLSTEKYKGGDFYIWDGEDVHIKQFNEPGALLVFPSYFPHKVTPVTEGKRTTLVLWKKGPWWR